MKTIDDGQQVATGGYWMDGDYIAWEIWEYGRQSGYSRFVRANYIHDICIGSSKGRTCEELVP